jgi:hypothetical protein
MIKKAITLAANTNKFPLPNCIPLQHIIIILFNAKSGGVILLNVYCGVGVELKICKIVFIKNDSIQSYHNTNHIGKDFICKFVKR